MTALPALREALRRMRNFHEDESLVARWAACLARLGPWISAGRRRLLLSLASLGLLVVSLAGTHTLPGENPASSPAMRTTLAIPFALALFALCYLAALRFDRLPAVVRRRPQVTLHLLFWVVLAVLWATPTAESLWRQAIAQFALVLPFVLWRCGYLLKSGQRGRAKGSAWSDHAFYLWPVWGGSETPYGKGFDYLVRSEAQSAEAFARAQLAGLKLLGLAVVWKAAVALMRYLVWGDPDSPLAGPFDGYTLGIPRVATLISGASAAPLPVAWLSVYCDLVWNTLKLAAVGHVYIGVLRLCGFAVFRNTYKPLLSESIVEFWNRYYYYFKELMVEFFFFPTFARCRVRPWLRTFLAIFAAAFAGNLYYHVIAEQPRLVAGDFAGLWGTYHPRVFYCFLLAAGIFVSMQREQKRRGQSAAARGGMARRVVRIAGVWTFYGIIHIWGVAGGASTFGQRTRFALSLVGLG